MWKVLVELDERYCPYRLPEDYQMDFCGKVHHRCSKENCPMNPQNIAKGKVVLEKEIVDLKQKIALLNLKIKNR